eukprot:UN27806
MQGDTIITWLEPAKSDSDSVLGKKSEPMDCALSFQDENACTLTWDWLVQCLGGTSRTVLENEENIEKIPLLTIDNMETVKERLNSFTLDEVEWTELVQNNWFEHLYEVFLHFESKNDHQSCGEIWLLLSEVVQSLNNKPFLQHIIQDKTREKLVHLAEYNPYRKNKRADKRGNRTSLRKKLKACSRIHLPGLSMPVAIAMAAKTLYELTFFRDVVLLSVMDDVATSFLNLQIHNLNLQVVTQVMEDEFLIKNIFEKVKVLAQTSCENRKDYEDR